MSKHHNIIVVLPGSGNSGVGLGKGVEGMNALGALHPIGQALVHDQIQFHCDSKFPRLDSHQHAAEADPTNLR